MGDRSFFKSWRDDPFKCGLIIVLAVVGCVFLWRDYGQQFLDFVAGREQPLSAWGEGSLGFAPPETVSVPLLGEVRIGVLPLPVLAVLLGLVDGFNPCAMWALVYLISLVAGLNDRRKIWLLVGSFVFASGVLYFLFMTAWLNVFLFVGYLRLLTITVGLFALGVGILDIREFFAVKGALTCPVGDGAAKQHALGKMRAIVRAPLAFGSFLAILLLAFTVNSIEFACSAALPAIFTHTLSLRSLSSFQYYGYILLYDFFFMLDDLVIFGLAVLTLETTLGAKYVKQCKLLGGIVLAGLGFLMLFMPETLR